MRKFTSLIVAAVMLFSLTSSPVSAEQQNNVHINSDDEGVVQLAASQLVAFPGAEGGGMYTTGARGASSPTIYHVTNLNDSGSGSLRDAVSKDNRIIVFDVAGTIKLEKQLSISKKNLTILGQTAPGDGICIKGSDTYLTGQNIIMRYIRFRMGTPNETQELNTAQDVLNFLNSGVRDPEDAFGAKNASDFIIDHCSMSWSTDECCSVYAVKNATVQWCIIGEGLNQSIHVENGDDWQEHSYGGLVGGINLAFHHNLWANCKGRFPRIATSSNVSTYNNTDDKLSLTDVRNNVMYNWGVSNSYGGENLTRVNLVSNYYKEGPASTAKNRFYQMSLTPAKKLGVAGKAGWTTDLAIGGNYYEPRKSSSKADQMNADNKVGVTSYSDATAYKLIDYDESNMSDADMASHMEYIKDYPITTTDAKTAFDAIMKYAGVSHRRDSVDARLVNDALNGTGTVGKNGLLNFPGNLLNPSKNNSDPAAWPKLSGTKEQDSDNDGIPDAWEDEHGLNKNSSADALQKADSGYYNIEEYANSIIDVADIPPATPVPTRNPNEPTATPKPTAKPTATPKPTDDPNQTPGPTVNPELGIMAQNESKFWKFDNESYYGSYTSNTVYDNLLICADGKDVAIEKSAKTVADIEFAGRLKLRGKGSETNRSVMFLPGKNGTVTIYCMSGGSDEREFNIYQGGNVVDEYFPLVAPDPGISYTVEVKSGVPVYMYSTDNGINIYGINYEISSEINNPTAEPSASVTPEPTAASTALPTNTPSPTSTPTLKPTETPSVTQSPTSTVKPADPNETPKADSGVYYIGEPLKENNKVTAKIVNNTDDGGVLFVAAAYDENGMLAEIKTVVIPKSGKEFNVSEVFTKEYSDIKLFLWSKETLTPYDNVK